MQKNLWCSDEFARFMCKELGFDNNLGSTDWPQIDTDHAEYIDYLDLSKDTRGMISFHTKASIVKAGLSDDSTEEDDYNPKFRIKARAGKVFRKLFACAGMEKSSDQIAEIVRKWYLFTGVNSEGYEASGIKFELCSGERIKWGYYKNNYIDQEECSLGLYSCMCGRDAQGYLDIYTKNPQVQLMVMTINGSIVGRSIVWLGKYHDRVYANTQTNADILTEYMHSWGLVNVWRSTQANVPEYIQLDRTEFDYYPYIDTYYYIDVDSNRAYMNMPRNGNEVRTCRCTDGSYEEQDRYECYNCGRGISSDDVYWVNDEPYCNECAVYSEHHDCNILRSSAVWSDCLNTYLHEDDAVYCENRSDYTADNRAIQLHDGTYLDEGDRDIIKLYNDEYADSQHDNIIYLKYSDCYALADDDSIVELHDGNYAFEDDCVQLYTDEYALETDCIELYDSTYALESDPDIVECFDGLYMHKDDTVTTYNGLVCAMEDCEQLRDGSWALMSDPVIESDDMQELKYA